MVAHAILVVVAATAIGLAACSKSSNSPLPHVSPTPTVSPTVGPSSTPPASSIGIAYLPDVGNAGPAGITAMHFETFAGGAFPYTPQFVNFQGSVRYFAVDPAGASGLAVLKSPTGAYALLQAVLGINTGTIFPGGPAYNTSVVPPSPAPTNAVIADVTGEGMIATGIDAVGLSIGPSALGILGVNQASTQAPTYNGFIGFACQGRTATHASGYVAVTASPVVNAQSGKYSVLVRGPQSLLSFSVVPNFGVVPPRYTFCFQAEDTTLGANILSIPGASGRGLMAFSPQDPSRALLGQVGNVTTDVLLIAGLPFKIQRSSALALTGGRINSIAVSPNGQFAAVGTTLGLFIVKGVNTSGLTIVGQGSGGSKGPYSPNYKGADGKYHQVKNVTSVGFSADGTYLAALVSLIPDSPGGGTNGSLVVLPFNSVTGILTAPAVAVNNLPLNAYYQDVLTVR